MPWYPVAHMHPAPSILTPPRIATEAFTDSTAAVGRLEEIYQRNIAFLRDCFGAYAKGEVINARVRATYPFVRIATATHARLELTTFIRLRHRAGRVRDYRNAA